MITKAELQAQAESLAKMAGLNTPEEIGVVVIFANRQTGDFALRGTKIDRERMREILKTTLKDYGQQIITPNGVDRG